MPRRTAPPVEIERKFLLRAFPLEAADGHAQELWQGYIPGKTLIERLRRVEDERGTRYFRTVKVGKGVTRIELEEETSAKIFKTMWPLTKGRRVKKTRYAIKVGKQTWEIDRFHDRNLVLAEVELKSEREKITPPLWVKKNIVREVTHDPNYINAHLAK